MDDWSVAAGRVMERARDGRWHELKMDACVAVAMCVESATERCRVMCGIEYLPASSE